MRNHRGFHEEIQQQQKLYPTSHRIQPVSPKEYAEVLTLHTAKQLSETFQTLVDQDQYEQAIQLSEKVASQLGKHTNFSLPLSTVLYSLNEMELPISEEFSLHRLKLLGNHQTHDNFFKALKHEMLTADRVDFMVSFTRCSGVQLLIPPLQELAKRHVPVRIITSTYMGITEPKALRHLLQFENVELRIVNEYKKSFHTKAYLFERCSGQHSVIVGSSNLSQAALTTGYELNVRLPETRYLPVYQQTKDLFDTVWNEKTQPVDEQFLQAYEEFQAGSQKVSASFAAQNSLYKTKMSPNAMQKEALRNLKKQETKGRQKQSSSPPLEPEKHF